ncbi:hypothetical protein, partial [Undibacterium sp. Xuan67W]|uniref:hypothetical protein n=1 Tax=Undibacterium sp. Xuan67W TaxID=3413057 RepID=UPI003BF00D80
ILSRCFTIQSNVIHTTADYRPSNMKTLISRGFKVSSKVWEVHYVGAKKKRPDKKFLGSAYKVERLQCRVSL